MLYAVAGLQHYMTGLGEVKSVLLRNPKDILAVEEGAVSFDVVTVGEGFTYQWYKDGELIEGETGSSYEIENVTLEDNGTFYSVEVNNNGDVNETPQARLTVIPTRTDVITSNNQDIDLAELNIFPNPSTNRNLTIRSIERIASINIYDISGKAISVIENPESSLELSHLDEGVYILNITTVNGEIFIRKVIFE